MKIGCIIQARTSSSRLPKKVLMELPYGSSITVLQQVIRRVKQAQSLHEVVVATTHDAEDEVIVEIAASENAGFFRGSLDNVLERYYLAAKAFSLDVIVRITSDCPCTDPAILDRCVREHIKSTADYSSNSIHKKWPRGIDIEVFNFTLLEEAYLNATSNYEKEHVTYYMYKTVGERIKIHSIEAEGPDCSDTRITLDRAEDYTLLCAVFDYLYPADPFFDASAINALFDAKPWLHFINASVNQKKIYPSAQAEVEAAVKWAELEGMEETKKVLSAYLSGIAIKST